MKNIKLLDEFKTFVARGNVVDMAVGIIIGAAFSTVVSSLVADILMPPIGLVVGGVDFTGLRVGIGNDVFIQYGKFIQATFNFLLTAFAVFIVIKLMNRLRESIEHKNNQQQASIDKSVDSQQELLKEIRDILKSKQL